MVQTPEDEEAESDLGSAFESEMEAWLDDAEDFYPDTCTLEEPEECDACQ